MKRLLIPGLAAVLGLTGCVESALDPNAQVKVTGEALRENEAPLADTTLKLFRDGSSTCLLPGHFKDVQTDTNGLFTFDLTGAETQTDSDLARCFRLMLPTDAKGAGLYADFLVQIEEVEIPELRLWNGAVTAATATEGAEVTFTKLFDTHGYDGTTTLRLTREMDLAWRVEEATSPVALSAHVLEDFANLDAQLHVARSVNGSGTEFKLHYDSDKADVPAGTLVPVSRGAKCTIADKTYESACPYTDGKLDVVSADSGPELKVTFATPTKLKKAVLRDLSHNIAAKVVIEGSADGGQNWTQLAELPQGATNDFIEVDLSQTAPAVDVVRLSVQGQGEPKILSLREVSYFE